MENDLWLLLAAIGIIAIVAGFIHSAIGFGFGIVAISLMPFIMDAKSAHVVVSVSSVPMLMMAAWAYREGIEWKSLRQALLGAAIFLPLGIYLFEAASLDWLVRGTGLGILCMVVMSLRNQRPPTVRESSNGSSFAAGAIAGFLAGAVSIAGPPIAAFAFKQDWSQARFKAFVTQCLLVIAIYKAGWLAARGYLEGDTVWQVAVVSVFAIGGIQLGVIASRQISSQSFRRVVAIALVLVSCSMMWRGEGKSDGPLPASPPNASNR